MPEPEPIVTGAELSQENINDSTQEESIKYLEVPNNFMNNSEESSSYLLHAQRFSNKYITISQDIISFAEAGKFNEIDELANIIHLEAKEIGALRLAGIATDLALSTSLPKDVLDEALQVFESEIQNVIKEIQNLEQ